MPICQRPARRVAPVAAADQLELGQGQVGVGFQNCTCARIRRSRWWPLDVGGDVCCAAPSDTATKDYNERMKSAMPQTVWVTGCKSWYLGKDGLPELFPWTPVRHRELLRIPETAQFDARVA
jgi:hypothetical protein